MHLRRLPSGRWQATVMQPVMVRMPPALYAELQRLAEQDDRSVSWVIRKAVRQYVKEAR